MGKFLALSVRPAHGLLPHQLEPIARPAVRHRRLVGEVGDVTALRARAGDEATATTEKARVEMLLKSLCEGIALYAGQFCRYVLRFTGGAILPSSLTAPSHASQNSTAS